MPEIPQNQLQTYLQDIAHRPLSASGDFAPVYLIFGDEYLCRTAFNALLDALLPEARRHLNCEIFDGESVDISEVIELVNTFSLVEGRRVVAVRHIRLFSQGSTVSREEASALQQAIEKGFPAGHYLILTTDTADKRRSLYQLIKNKGMTIDCAVPKGNRASDRKAQAAILAEETRTLLAQYGKTIKPGAYQALTELTGFDLRTHIANLEKLMTYISDRREITEADVQALLKRTRQDPVYELTGAVAERDTEKSLFYLDSLLSAGLYPLQILTALINQFRRLLLMKMFASSFGGRYAGMPFRTFQQKVLPAVREYDQQTLIQVEARERLQGAQPEPSSSPRKKKKKAATDLLLATNVGNPYPVYLQLQKVQKFTPDELFDCFEQLHTADLQLKTTAHNPRIILENLILHICRGGKHVENQNRMHHRSVM